MESWDSYGATFLTTILYLTVGIIDMSRIDCCSITWWAIGTSSEGKFFLSGNRKSRLSLAGCKIGKYVAANSTPHKNFKRTHK